MSDPRLALERLAARYGIAAAYHDIGGRRIEVSDASLVALLAAFEVDASTTEQVEQADRRADDASWHEALPPVCAITAGQSGWNVVLRLPAAPGPLRWTLLEEQGQQHTGETDAAELQELASATVDGEPMRACRLAIPTPLPPGYHRLRVDGLTGETCVIAAPPSAYQPPAVAGDGRVWGVAAQLYALRSQRNWGMGDFGDLLPLIDAWAARGAQAVGLNPLHALFTHNPPHASPYSPSSRRQLNVLYIAVEEVEDYAECEAARERVAAAPFQARLAALRDAPLVDHPGVAGAKFEVLELLYAHFRTRHLAAGSERAQAFRAFQAAGGPALRLHALFEALQAHWHAQDPAVWGWPVWPEAYRDPASPEVRRYAEQQLERIEWHEYLQWQAHRQLARAAQRCAERGMAVGLYLDLAVSVDRAGSDVWSQRACYAEAASVGAPPDDFNAEGQGWGLPPLRPDRLRASRYRLFIETLRENMRHAGALRIDHVMGLMRLFWIPPGKSPRDGGYVHYPLDELLAIVVLESHRNRCLVVGEDLGTVPDEMRNAMARTKLLSCRLLYFERTGDGGFKSPEQYPRDALVSVGTHDLPTLAGWWQGEDLRVRRSLGMLGDDAALEEQLRARTQDRERLLRAIEGVIPAQAGIHSPPTADTRAPPLEPIHAFLAATPSRVMLLQLEDALGVVDQPNLPGTTDEHPNWRRKLPLPVERMRDDERIAALSAALSSRRPRPPLQARIPRATYRLQLHQDFDFDAAAGVVPYLARLGISHVYCSPILRARPGSTHGYDIVAHDQINPELGGAAGFERLVAVLRAHGMGLLLDIVPNHMGVGADNPWWLDVLESGPAAEHARHFDIDWHPADPTMEGKVLLPVLGDHYGDVLADGQLVLGFDAARGSFTMHYHEHRFPLDPCTYVPILRQAAGVAEGPQARAALRRLAAECAELPPRGLHGEAAAAARRAGMHSLKTDLANAAAQQLPVGRAIDVALAQLNAEGPRDALHALMEAQAWRLAYWRVAADEINYRRFFDINDLAALRMEEPEVFEATHALVLDLTASGVVDGLRIDHPDGLQDPALYFRWLQQGHAQRAGIALPERDEQGRHALPLYVVAEKIAAPHENVPTDWAIHGTTGYRFANLAAGVLVDRAARARFDRTWRAFSGVDDDFEEIAWGGKHAIMRSTLASPLTVLASELLRIARADRRTRDYTYNTLRRALAEAAACMPVYRTYIVDTPSAQDRRYIDWAIAQARRRSREADVSIFDFVRRCLLGETADDAPEPLRLRVRGFAMRFQQFSAPVAAKGVEDTAFYRYSRLVALNEVGGDPGTFGLTVRAFHGASADRAANWPHTIIATSTHDNKRSEDVRHRIAVLSERPAAWRLALRRWRTMNRSHRRDIDGRSAPSAADESLLYQTLLGSLPPGDLDEEALAAWRERIEAYMLKAAREAKLHTSWISPDEAYEGALQAFVRGALGRLRPNPFLDDLRVLGDAVAWFGALNSLSATLLKFTAPGVPDLYQGNELMDLSLVDPDNRRPVDYGLRERWLGEMEALAGQPGLAQVVGAMARTLHDGRAKLWLTWRLLALLREQPAFFRDAGYAPLVSRGSKAAHVLAYAREHEGRQLVVVVGRLYAQLLGEPGRLPLGASVWSDTSVAIASRAPSSLRNLLTGQIVPVLRGQVRLADAFADFPAAALLDDSLSPLGSGF